MFRFVRTLFFSFVLFSAYTLQGEIIETKDIYDLPKYLEKDMLVIFDIDNTLIEPVQEVGSDQWFKSRIDKYEFQNYSSSVALELALKEWRAVQYLTNVKVLQKGTAEMVADLQSKGIPAMGLTTRGMEMCVRAIEQLESVKIDLSKTAPSKQEAYFFNERGVFFTEGVLFTQNTHKGEALRKYLASIDYRPSSILFINDKLSDIKSVEQMCNEDSIKFIGIRYGRVDEKVKNPRHHIAEAQWKMFGHILSDEAAETMLKDL